jgi:hypothetical protein
MSLTGLKVDDFYLSACLFDDAIEGVAIAGVVFIRVFIDMGHR